MLVERLAEVLDGARAPGPIARRRVWDGYPVSRRRLLETIRSKRTRNPLFIGGDMHGTYIADLHLDPSDPSTPGVATEFCGTSITSEGLTAAQTEQTAADNPPLAFVDGHPRGYVAFELTAKTCTARARGCDTTRKDGGVDTLATFVVEDGHPTVKPG